jgi:hypothetical protein
MIPAAVFHIVAVLSGHGQSGALGQFVWPEQSCMSHGAGGQRCTQHSPIRRHRDHWSEGSRLVQITQSCLTTGASPVAGDFVVVVVERMR